MLNARADEKGIVLNYIEYPHRVQVWMLLNFPDSKKAKPEIVELFTNF